MAWPMTGVSPENFYGTPRLLICLGVEDGIITKAHFTKPDQAGGIWKMIYVDFSRCVYHHPTCTAVWEAAGVAGGCFLRSQSGCLSDRHITAGAAVCLRVVSSTGGVSGGGVYSDSSSSPTAPQTSRLTGSAVSCRNPQQAGPLWAVSAADSRRTAATRSVVLVSERSWHLNGRRTKEHVCGFSSNERKRFFHPDNKMKEKEGRTRNKTLMDQNQADRFH